MSAIYVSELLETRVEIRTPAFSYVHRVKFSVDNIVGFGVVEGGMEGSHTDCLIACKGRRKEEGGKSRRFRDG